MAVSTPFVKGDRLYLREVRQTDVNEDYYNWLSDPEVNQYLETRFIPNSPQTIAKFVERMDGNPNEILFAICVLESDAHIGNIKIGPINWVHRYADISLLIGNKNYWGKGFATEAIGLITRFGFQELNMNRLKASCYEGNKGSFKAFLKIGYTHEGTMRKHFFSKGQFQDGYQLGMLAEEFWQKQTEK